MRPSVAALRIEIGEAEIFLRGGPVDFIAHAQVYGEIGAGLPVVIEIGPVVSQPLVIPARRHIAAG